MPSTTFVKKPFYVSLVAGSSNPFTMSVDLVDDDDVVEGPFDASDFPRYFAEAGPIPTKEVPLAPESQRVRFNVTVLADYIRDGEVTAHPGSFLLSTNPDDSEAFQTEGIDYGQMEVFGVSDNGNRELVAFGYFGAQFVNTKRFD